VTLADPQTLEIPEGLRDAILSWYDRVGRDLPFRRTLDPYAILVSEAMAQQTQAARAGAAWGGFMERFPTVLSLAAATPAEVLRAWHGLGYNRRALNLWRAAKQIVEEHQGRVPADLAGLEALPGVGPYTARAVAAIAFGVPVGAVDTNVRRVLGRIVAGDAAALTASAMQLLADAAVPRDRPGPWTHALMDLGASLCGPSTQLCGSCPAQTWCRFSRAGSTRRRLAATGRPGRGSPGSGTSARSSAVPFPATSRWLRGRIVARLRASVGDDWVAIDAPIGSHDAPAVRAAIIGLARDGLVELDAAMTGVGADADRSRWLVRLPLA
jgi:A/G-specific adenine glycosylase